MEIQKWDKKRGMQRNKTTGAPLRGIALSGVADGRAGQESHRADRFEALESGSRPRQRGGYCNHPCVLELGNYLNCVVKSVKDITNLRLCT